MRNKTYTPEEDMLWEQLRSLQGETFQTAKHLDFHYTIRSNEMFVSRKDKSITRATVNMAWQNARVLGGLISGPKQLKTFGASYLYPVFLRLGLIQKMGQQEMDFAQRKEERE